MSSCGFIETVGLVSAIEAADAMTKSAYVHLENFHHVGSGIIMLSVSGDLASVQSAVQAGCAAVQGLPGGVLRASNVIARPEYPSHVFSPQKPSLTPCSQEKNTEENSQETLKETNTASTHVPPKAHTQRAPKTRQQAQQAVRRASSKPPTERK